MVISRAERWCFGRSSSLFPAKNLWKQQRFPLTLGYSFFESKDLRMDFSTSCFDRCEALNAFKENCLRFRNCMPEDGAVVKQLGGEAVDHNFYVDDGYLL